MPLSASISTRLQHQHKTLGELTAGFSEEQLKRRIDPGKWSAFENIAHLTAYQPVFIRRIERILEERDPVFERYVAEKDPLFPAYLESPLAGLTHLIAGERSIITDKLAGLDETALQRTGLHPKYGLLTMRQWTEFFLLHEAHHLFTLFILVQELRTATDPSIH